MKILICGAGVIRCELAHMLCYTGDQAARIFAFSDYSSCVSISPSLTG